MLPVNHWEAENIGDGQKNAWAQDHTFEGSVVLPDGFTAVQENISTYLFLNVRQTLTL